MPNGVRKTGNTLNISYIVDAINVDPVVYEYKKKFDKYIIFLSTQK